MSRRPVIPRECGLWSHGNRCCIGTTRTKSCCIGTKSTKLVASSPRSFRWSPEYMGSPHGLTTTSQKCSWSPKCKNSAYGPKCTKTMGSGGFLRSCKVAELVGVLVAETIHPACMCEGGGRGGQRGGRVLEDYGLLDTTGSRHTTQPAHAGVGGHHRTVSPLFFIAYPRTRVPAPSVLGPYADATGAGSSTHGSTALKRVPLLH
jgi:hypothetical protein